MATPIASLGTALVGLLATVVTGASYRAMVRTGNPALGYVVAAFLVLALKSAAKLFFLVRIGDIAATWEIVFTLADVAMVALIATPLLRRGLA